MNILLITATIKPLVKVVHSDPEVRCAEYVRNLKRYIRETNFDTIIFAENSGYKFDASEIFALAEQKNKRFEMLDLSGSADSTTMSSGEAYLMRQALEQCSFLNDDDMVWKITGRIYIRNINKVLAAAQKKIPATNAIFLYAPAYDSMQTWFFRAKVGDMKTLLLTDPVIEEMKCGCIEFAWMDCYRNNKDKMHISPFPIYPDAEGINSSGRPYTLPYWKRAVNTLLLKLGRFTVNVNRPRKKREGL